MHTQFGMEYAFNETKKMIDKYHKYGGIFVLDWEVYGYYHPKYDQKIEVLAPQFVARFVH